MWHNKKQGKINFWSMSQDIGNLYSDGRKHYLFIQVQECNIGPVIISLYSRLTIYMLMVTTGETKYLKQIAWCSRIWQGSGHNLEDSRYMYTYRILFIILYLHHNSDFLRWFLEFFVFLRSFSSHDSCYVYIHIDKQHHTIYSVLI